MSGVCGRCGCWTAEGRVVQWHSPEQPVLACPLCPPGRAEQIAYVAVLLAMIVVLVYATATRR
ncbi:hypothetical protein [Streptomyces daliensis]|uniref:Uncharacterized protein n=1 Tax=Streptomyces daliensis TaxID=299421 RepID=A0A8T4IXX7_9ACTN|nr:hypothetical protein [Streptomyces daliensis]